MEIQNLDDVRVFAQVVQLGSFSAAARKLSLPKSTVSRRVSALEAQLGARLLQRTTRSLNLTDAGEVFFRRAERMLEEAEAAEREVATMLAAPRGTLRVTAPADANLYLANALTEFQRAYPEITLLLTLTNRQVDLIAEGIDVAVRAGTMPDSSLMARRLTTNSFGLYASPEYLARRGTPERASQLAEHNCVVADAQRAEVVWRSDGPGEPRELMVRGIIGANDFGMVRLLAVSGAGIAALPCVVAAGPVRAGELVRVLPDFGSTQGGLYLVYPSPRHLTPNVRAFIDFLQARVDAAGGEVW